MGLPMLRKILFGVILLLALIAGGALVLPYASGQGPYVVDYGQLHQDRSEGVG